MNISHKHPYGFLLPLLLWISMIVATMASNSFMVCGIVAEEVPYWDPELLSILNATHPEEMNKNELSEISEKIMAFLAPRPKVGLPVWITGNGATQECTSDANGRFCFSNIPAGDYRVSISNINPVMVSNTQETRIIYVRKDVSNVRMLCPVNQLRIQGRVIDKQGHPLENANVRGILIPAGNRQAALTTYSTSNGYFEFTHIQPAAFHRSAPIYLMGEDPLTYDEIPTAVFVEIHVEKEGFGKIDAPIFRIPLISEHMLPLVKFWKALMLQDAKLRENAFSRLRKTAQYQKQKDYMPENMPKTIGNTIFVDDIILEKLEDASTIME